MSIVGKLKIVENHIGKSPVRRGPRSALRRCHKLVGILIRIARKQTERPQFGLEIPRHTAKQVAVGPDAPHSQYRPAGNCHRKTDRITIACDRRSPLAAAAFLLVFIQRSEEHTSELQSLMRISYAVFCLNKKKN